MNSDKSLTDSHHRHLSETRKDIESMDEGSFHTAQRQQADAISLSQQRLESLINAIDGIVKQSGGAERILLVEDDEAVRALAGKVL
jgi:hypothetical protein